MSLVKAEPLPIRVAPIVVDSRGNRIPTKVYEGYLVDTEGNFLDSPICGKPLCAVGSLEADRIDCLTRNIVDIVHDVNGGWTVRTENDILVEVKNNRRYN